MYFSFSLFTHILGVPDNVFIIIVLVQFCFYSKTKSTNITIQATHRSSGETLELNHHLISIKFPPHLFINLLNGCPFLECVYG